METFVLSAVLSFVVYECLVYVDVPPRRGWFRIGDVSINFDAASAKWAHRALIAVIVFALLLSILFIHEIIFPLDRISRNKVNIILGLLFGPLFAIWLNSVFNYPPGKPLSRGQIVGGVGLVLFCLIGSAGTQTGKLLEQLARKISGLKGLGFELSLSEPSRKKDPSQGATSFAGSQSSSKFASSSGSVGLEYVSQLDDIVQRDEDYLKLLFGQTDVQLSDQLERAKDLAKLAIKPPLKCLAAWFEATADATFVNDHLGPFVTAFRQVSTLHSEQRRRDVSRIFVGSMAAIALDVEAFGAPPAVETGCASLLQIFCSANIEILPDTGIRIADRPALMECLRTLSEAEGSHQLQASAKDRAEELSEKLRLFVADDALDTRPYFAIAYASLMAQLGQYETAAYILDGWLDRQKARLGGSGKVVDDWFQLRIRSILAAYFEEWLLKQGSSAATAFRNEHLKNLDVLRTSLEGLLVKPGFLAEKTGRSAREAAEFRVPGACAESIVEPQRRLWRRLLSSYISMELTHIQNRLRHPYYLSKFVESTNSDIGRLVDLDLSCLSEYPPPALVYAQILDSYALNIVQYAKAKKEIESSGVREERFRTAGKAIAYGLEITHDRAQLDLNRSSVALLARVAPSDWVSARESLQQTGKELRDALEE